MRRRSVAKRTLVAGAIILISGFCGYVILREYALRDQRSATDHRANAESTAGATPPSSLGVGFIGYSDALDEQSFEGTKVGGLSALTYDARRGLYYSLVDKEKGTPARFYTLRVPLDGARLGDPEITDVTTLRDSEEQPFMGGDLDGEGVAVSSGGELFVASETEPSIRRFSLDGRLLAELPVPQKFLVEPEGGGRANGTFESLSLSPDGASLFTANEEKLAPDGQDPEGHKRIRVLRYERGGAGGFEPSEEFFYLTESRTGVADVAALSESELLVLEHDNRVFRVALEGAEDVSNKKSLAAPGLEPLERELLVDPADYAQDGAGGSGARVGSTELGNLEGLALGARLPDGRLALLLQNDDGFYAGRVTRIVALSVGLQDPSLGMEGSQGMQSKQFVSVTVQDDPALDPEVQVPTPRA
jgi:hypothetical protein